MRFAKGHNKDYAPMPPIRLFSRLRDKYDRLMRFFKGDNKYSAPFCSI